MSKRDYCIHFVDISHLSSLERRDAAVWAFEQFGRESVDVMHPKENFSSRVPGFWFGREKDANWFTLRWSK